MESKRLKQTHRTGHSMGDKDMATIFSKTNSKSTAYFSMMICLVALTACSDKMTGKEAAQKMGKTNITSQIGWAHNNCIAIKNTAIKAGEKLTLVSFEAEQQLLDGVIVGKTDDGAKCPALLDDRKEINKSEGYTFYVIKTDNKVNMAIGLIGKNIQFKKVNKLVTADINGDGKQDYFSQCVSSEGIHFGGILRCGLRLLQ